MWISEYVGYISWIIEDRNILVLLRRDSTESFSYSDDLRDQVLAFKERAGEPQGSVAPYYEESPDIHVLLTCHNDGSGREMVKIERVDTPPHYSYSSEVITCNLGGEHIQRCSHYYAPHIFIYVDGKKVNIHEVNGVFFPEEESVS